MSDDDTAALAKDRSDGGLIREYLDALRVSKPNRGHLLAAVDGRQQQVAPAALEDAFVEVAETYSERHGISYAAWRELDVPDAVLRRAGITHPRS